MVVQGLCIFVVKPLEDSDRVVRTSSDQHAVGGARKMEVNWRERKYGEVWGVKSMYRTTVRFNMGEGGSEEYLPTCPCITSTHPPISRSYVAA
jgi:hypothetical protein